MFGWFNKNPTKDLPLYRSDRLSVDLERQSLNGIPGTPCDVRALSSFGKASGYKRYPDGHVFSWRESGFSLCNFRSRITSIKFYILSETGSRFASCKLEILLGNSKLLLQPETTGNEIMEFLGEPSDAFDFADDAFDVGWEGSGWSLNCAFDRSTGLEIVDVDFLSDDEE